MNLLDIISPKKHGKKRFTPSFFAKSTFVISLLVFCFFVLETILLGKALNIDPYNQPSVELIKKETKKILI